MNIKGDNKQKVRENNWARMWLCSPIDRVRWVNKTLFKTPLKGNHPCPRWSIYQGRVHLQHPHSSFTHRLGTLPVKYGIPIYNKIFRIISHGGNVIGDMVFVYLNIQFECEVGVGFPFLFSPSSPWSKYNLNVLGVAAVPCFPTLVNKLQFYLYKTL